MRSCCKKEVKFDDTMSAHHTPLHALSYATSTRFIQYLKQTYSVDAVNKGGLIPLHAIVFQLNSPLVGKRVDHHSRTVIEELYNSSVDRSANLRRPWENFCNNVVGRWGRHAVNVVKANLRMVLTAKAFRDVGISGCYKLTTGQSASSILFKPLALLPDATLQTQMESVIDLLDLFLGDESSNDTNVAHDPSLYKLLMRSLVKQVTFERLRIALLQHGVCAACAPNKLEVRALEGPPICASAGI
jgi:hypothetical protein